MNLAAAYMQELTALARQTVTESCVLMRNENHTLPLTAGMRVAVFGTAQLHYYPSGLGSGGLVNTNGMTGLYDALAESGLCTLNETVRSAYKAWEMAHPFQTGDGWARHPWAQEEMPLTDELLDAASADAEAAIVIIGRTAGEDKDNQDVPGSWHLTSAEEAMIAQVSARFARTAVLLNVGNVMDMTWIERTKPGAVLYIWQGGQEGARGTVDVVFGRTAPSGRLTDTIALSAADYPSAPNHGSETRNVYAEDVYVGYRYFETFASEKVLYPFGYGLSYTTFAHTPISVERVGEKVTLRSQVGNTGDAVASEVVQAYVQAPQGRLGKPVRVLCGFDKTAQLAPGEQTEVTITAPLTDLASYDDSGVTGHRSCWLLEAGEYRFYLGANVREAAFAGSFTLEEDLVLEQLTEACAPQTSFERLRPGADGAAVYEPAPLATHGVNGLRAAHIPEEIPQTGDRGLKLADAAEGRCSLRDFVAQFSDEDLHTIVRGEGMSSSRVTPGTAGCIGGVSDSLTAMGIPAVCCSDGPSGIRMDCGNTAFYLPSGTAQACTWNRGLIRELYAREALDMRKNRIDMLLAPGMNIHRSPLNGRNFEYFSEDPLVTGRMASAQLAGLHRYGVTGVIKHFACNSQEFCRRKVEAVVSERALREIYLRGFELAVREGQARSIMTSYNPINGVYAASSHDLLTVILRQQWGFTGAVMTDWWAFGSNDDLNPSTTYMASMIRAQNDLFMVMNDPASNSGNDDSSAEMAAGRVSRAEYQRSAMSICRTVIGMPAFERLCGHETELDRQLEEQREAEGDVMLDVRAMTVGAETMISGSEINLTAGGATLYQAHLEKRGVFAISIRYRVAEAVTGVTQVSLAVSQDSRLLGMETHTGEDHDWHMLEAVTSPIRRRLIFYLRLFSATGGIEIDYVQVKRIETWEE